MQSTGYVNWGTNEPNNLGNEDCGSMHVTGTLNDINCNTPLVFFCEIGSVFGKTTKGPSGDNGNVSDEDNGLNHTDDDGSKPSISKKSSRNPHWK